MTENMFVVVNHNGMKFLAETKTNYMLPIVDMEALCIMFNYLYRHGELPNVDTDGWWKKKEFQEYYEEDEWSKEE